ncbi:MAG: hypothetical protein HYV63_07585 [Candidatus Schekmanbacteria bacterium]|nr:hypothetical protein [Candidatus Schekmanbacteria bacterium]
MPGNPPRRVNRSASSPEDVAAVAKDLFRRRGERGQSVFRVQNRDEADTAAVIFAITCRPDPADVDYVLIPDECLAPLRLEIRAEPSTALHPFLGERHFEIVDLADDRVEDFARYVLADARYEALRINERSLVEKARDMLAKLPDLTGFLGLDWPDVLQARSSAS